MNDSEIIRDFYNKTAEDEWTRIEGRPEFLLTARFLDKYIKPGDNVLDIGGGPGRYSVYLAKKGAKVTLFDLSDVNVTMAKEKAKEENVDITAICGDAREVDKNVSGSFDAVLLMGPLYHLLDVHDREKAVNAALSLVKPGGVIFISFLSMVSGFIFAMTHAPESILSQNPMEIEYMHNFTEGKNYAGDAFTRAFFIQPSEIIPFMNRFPVNKLHLFGQEGIMSPCEEKLMSSSPEIIEGWLDLCEKASDNEALLSWAEHIMYVGRKPREDNIAVRRAEKRDIPKVLDLLHQVCDVHAAGRPDIFIHGKTKYGPDELMTIFNDEKTPVFVAETDGKVVGYAFCKLLEYKDHAVFRDYKSLYIDDVCVDESSREGHVGTRLFEAVKAFAKDEECYNITLNVWAFNAPAMKFYESLGMTEQREYKEYVL